MKITLNKVLILLILTPALSHASMPYSAFKKEILNTHNQYRAKHHAPKLTWDKELADYAQHYASQCRFQHSNGQYGENLAMGYPTLRAALDAWYVEKNIYPYAKPGFSKYTGHFTQMVWASTTSIGCGYVACNGLNGTRGNYLVCEYNPHGNIVNAGYFEKNVLPEHA